MSDHDISGDMPDHSPCGHVDCAVSSGIHGDGFGDYPAYTFGRGELSDNGYWEIPCATCARAWEAAHPESGPCWPFADESVDEAPDPEPDYGPVNIRGNSRMIGPGMQILSPAAAAEFRAIVARRNNPENVASWRRIRGLPESEVSSATRPGSPGASDNS